MSFLAAQLQNFKHASDALNGTGAWLEERRGNFKQENQSDVSKTIVKYSPFSHKCVVYGILNHSNKDGLLFLYNRYIPAMHIV